MATVVTLLGLVLGGCSRGVNEPEPTASAPASSPAASSAAPSDPAPSSPEPESGFSPDAPDLVEQLVAQGYQCDDQVRCERRRAGVDQVIQLGPGRAVFVARDEDGSSDDPNDALASVLEDYGSVLPHGRFASLDWDTVTDWVADHSAERRAVTVLDGWQAVLSGAGPARKLVLESL